MYEKVQKSKGKVVDFDRMKGRSMIDAENEEELDDELHEELGVAREGEGLNLQIDDPHPHKVDVDSKVMGFADPKKHPRFQSDRRTREIQARYAEQTSLDVNDDILHERRDGTFVNMSKMPGRMSTVDVEEEDAEVDAWVYGKVDDEGAIQIGEEQARQIAQGQYAVKKRIKQGVDMSKQRGRNDVDDGDVYKHRLREEEEAAVVAIDAETRGTYFAEETIQPLPSGLAKKGLVAWDKQSASTSKQVEDVIVQDAAEIGHGREELDLSPTKVGTSGYG